MSKPWPMVALGEILRKTDDWIPIQPDVSYREVTVRLWGKGVALRREVLGAEIKSDRRLRVKSGQFIASRIDARNGAFGLIPAELDGAVVTNDFPVFEPDKAKLYVPFLGWMSKTATFVDLCKAASEGTTNRVRLKEERFLRTAIALPPLAEQRRIVARIEELAAKIAEARELRESAGATLSALRVRAVEESVDWDNHPTTALSELLTEGTLNGLGRRPNDSRPGYPILRISAGTSRTDATVNEDDVKYIDASDNEVAKYNLLPGDILACRFNGNLRYVGRFSRFVGRASEVRLYPDKLIRFRMNPARVSSEFVCLMMNSPRGREQIESCCATTAGNIGISAGDLKTVSIPVPSPITQRRIVAHLEGLAIKTEMLAESQSGTSAELDALLPSTLDRAFKGQL